MAEQSKKPKGFKAFDELNRKLLQVPKEECDAQVERGRKERKAKRKKK